MSIVELTTEKFFFKAPKNIKTTAKMSSSTVEALKIEIKSKVNCRRMVCWLIWICRGLGERVDENWKYTTKKSYLIFHCAMLSSVLSSTLFVYFFSWCSSANALRQFWNLHETEEISMLIFMMMIITAEYTRRIVKSKSHCLVFCSSWSTTKKKFCSKLYNILLGWLGQSM